MTGKSGSGPRSSVESVTNPKVGSRSSVEPVTNPKVSSRCRLVIIIVISVKYEYMGFASRKPKVSVKSTVECL